MAKPLVSLRSLHYRAQADAALRYLFRSEAREGFWRMMTTRPDDVAPRLIFADWLDEQENDADTELALLIREAHKDAFARSKKYGRIRSKWMNPKQWFGPRGFAHLFILGGGLPKEVTFQTWNHLWAWLPVLGHLPLLRIHCQQFQPLEDSAANGVFFATQREFNPTLSWQIPFAIARYMKDGIQEIFRAHDPTAKPRLELGQAVVDLARDLAGFAPRHNPTPINFIHELQDASHDGRTDTAPVHDL